MTDSAGGRPIRVLLVDDHGVVRRGLRGYLELLDDIEVVGEAENRLQGVEASAEHGHGRSNKEIAMDLGITERTARTQAALYAVERKLVHD